MNIKQLLSSSRTVRLYRNYNSVYLVDNIIVKRYKDDWRLQKEREALLLLQQNGVSCVPSIVEVSPPYIAFQYIDEPSFSERIYNNDVTAEELLASLFVFPRDLKTPYEFHHTRYKGRLLEKLHQLHKDNLLPLRAWETAREIIQSYRLTEREFVHGDLRPSNILGRRRVRAIIDWEMSEYGDINRDMAYLYFGALSDHFSQSDELLRSLRSVRGYNEVSFSFYMIFIYIACLGNPLWQVSSVLSYLKEFLMKCSI